jgi:hypothetical protein
VADNVFSCVAAAFDISFGHCEILYTPLVSLLVPLLDLVQVWVKE